MCALNWVSWVESNRWPTTVNTLHFLFWLQRLNLCSDWVEHFCAFLPFRTQQAQRHTLTNTERMNSICIGLWYFGGSVRPSQTNNSWHVQLCSRTPLRLFGDLHSFFVVFSIVFAHSLPFSHTLFATAFIRFFPVLALSHFSHSIVCAMRARVFACLFTFPMQFSVLYGLDIFFAG